MIGLSSVDADINGDIVIHNVSLSSLEPELVRRMTYALALNGTISVDDAGFFWSAQEITVRINNITKEQRDRIAYLVRTYGEMYLSVWYGYFLVQVQRWSPVTSELRLITKKKV